MNRDDFLAARGLGGSGDAEDPDLASRLIADHAPMRVRPDAREVGMWDVMLGDAVVVLGRKEFVDSEIARIQEWREAIWAAEAGK